MRARIIFRGLTLFTFEKPTADAKAGDNLGKLTAWLVSDPKHIGMPLHTHKPLLGLIGRDRGATPGVGRLETKRWIATQTKIELMGHDVPAGVTVDGSFLDYVPRLGALKYSQARSSDEVRAFLEKSDFVTSRIVIPSGTIRARDFITWDWYGNTPARVAYMDTNFHGFGTNEVIVDVGDDSDIGGDNGKKFLAISGRGINKVHKFVEPRTSKHDFSASLWPRAKATPDDDIDPNVVELRISNLPARRRRAVFWGLHFETLFDAAGYPRPTAYTNVDQYNAFIAAAMQYDPDEWQADYGAMGIGHPFPFLIDPRNDTLDELANGTRPALAAVPPLPHGRRKHEGILMGTKGDHADHAGHAGMGHDPENREICPFGII